MSTNEHGPFQVRNLNVQISAASLQSDFHFVGFAGGVGGNVHGASVGGDNGTVLVFLAILDEQSSVGSS